MAGETSVHGLMHQSKAADTGRAALEGGNNWGHTRSADGVHRDGSPDESIDRGIISEDAQECVETTTAWL